ncbi:MAG TPA: hypothetical protein VMW53_07400 [archaeon]|nr:hypothetical protein [archaeon]
MSDKMQLISPSKKKAQIALLKNPQGQMMFRRLKLMISNGQNLTDEEALALTNFALVEKLDPFIGECCLLKNNIGKVTGCMMGIKGMERKATEQMHQKDPNSYWFPYFRDIPIVEGERYRVECTIRDTITTQSHMEMYKQAETILKGDDINKPITAQDVRDLIGPTPEWTGIGVYHKNEANEFKDKHYPPYERAKKRALAIALRARFHFSNITDPDGAQTMSIGLDESEAIDENIIDVIEGDGEPMQIQDTSQPEAQNGTIEKINIESFKNRIQIAAAEIATKPGSRVLPQQSVGILCNVIEQEIFSPGEKPDTTKAKRYEILKFIFGKTSTKELKSEELLALWDFFGPSKDKNSGEWRITRPNGGKILRQILATTSEANGQQLKL